MSALQCKYEHLRSLPLPLIDRAQPLLLIGSDMPHLLTPVQPVCMGSANGPIAVYTRLGWTLQGPMGLSQTTLSTPQCLHITTTTLNTELFKNVEHLWQIDTLPCKREDSHLLQARPVCPLSSPDTYNQGRSEWCYAIRHSLAQTDQC